MGHETMAYLWLRLRRENIFETLFHDFPDMNFATFVREFSQAGLSWNGMVVRRKGDEVVEHMGVFSLSQMVRSERLKRALASFALFRDYWNQRDSDEAGHAGIAYAFDVVGLDVLGGVTPKANRAALSFIHRLGFESVGEVPGFVLYNGERTSAVVSYLDATKWRLRNG